MKEVTNYNVKCNADGVYRACARLTTPQMESPASLRKSAAAILNGLRCRAKKCGFILDRDTYLRAKDRIGEMSVYPQYEDFVSDANDIYAYLERSVKYGKNVAPAYLTTVNE